MCCHDLPDPEGPAAVAPPRWTTGCADPRPGPRCRPAAPAPIVRIARREPPPRAPPRATPAAPGRTGQRLRPESEGVGRAAAASVVQPPKGARRVAKAEPDVQDARPRDPPHDSARHIADGDRGGEESAGDPGLGQPNAPHGRSAVQGSCREEPLALFTRSAPQRSSSSSMANRPGVRVNCPGERSRPPRACFLPCAVSRRRPRTGSRSRARSGCSRRARAERGPCAPGGSARPRYVPR